MNFYGSSPGSANYRNRGNSNQPFPFSANLSVYASFHEKIYLGAYYSRLRNIKMGTIILRGLALFVAVGRASHAWEYLCFVMCRNYRWHSGLFGPFFKNQRVCVCPQKNPTHQEAGSGAGHTASYMSVSTWLSCLHQSGWNWSGQVSTKWIQKWILIMLFPPKTEARCGWALVSFCLMWKGFQWAVFVGADLSECCGQSKASCSLCSYEWSELTFAYPPESGDINSTNVLFIIIIIKKEKTL